MRYGTRRRCARENSAEDVMGFCMIDPIHTPRQTCSTMGFPGKTMDTAFNNEIEAVRPYDWCGRACYPIDIPRPNPTRFQTDDQVRYKQLHRVLASSTWKCPP